MHKQNFDLKLELYHRRQRQEELEARLEVAEKQISEQRELQEINDQLLAELEKRDQAVEEAVSIIVNLEDRIDRLMQEREIVRKFDAQSESNYFQSHHDASPPPTFTNHRTPGPGRDDRVITKMPSFLSEQSEGAEALRSLYLPNSSYSDATLPKLLEVVGSEVPDSPRLSVLSESSFLSVYGEKQLALDDANEGRDVPEDQRTHRKSSSVEKWVDERPVPETAAPQSIPRSDGLRTKHFLSINDVLESPLQRLEKLKLTLEKHNKSAISNQASTQSTMSKDKAMFKELPHRILTGPVGFENHRALPPTPDTFSTNTLSRYKRSNDTLGRQQNNRLVESSFLNSTSTFGTSPSYDFQSSPPVRPRSAGETITSRREGHGWDTETQDPTENGSISSTTSAFSTQPRYQTKRTITPDLFSFNHFDERQDMRDWGTDMMFDNDYPAGLALHTARRFDGHRRTSTVDHPRSDDTVMPSCGDISALNNVEGVSGEYGTISFDSSSHPETPLRRSSLSTTNKIRRNNDSSSAAENAGNSPASSKEKAIDGKKNRLSIPRFFGRSETAPAVNIIPYSNPPTPSTAISRLKDTGRSKSYVVDGVGYEDEQMARATPPPIRRNRVTGNERAAVAYRPVSAGANGPSGPQKARRMSIFGYDGPSDEKIEGRMAKNDIGSVEPEDGKSGGRKWLGFGRTGSMRRN